MKQVRSLPTQQRGVAIGLVLVIIALLAALGALMMSSSRGSFTNSNQEMNRINATSVMEQGMNLKLGFERMFPYVNADDVTFDTDATNGVFNPSKGGAMVQIPSPKAVVTPGTDVWVYKKTVKIKGIGLDANPDYLVALPNVTLETCRHINNQVHNTALSATPPTGAGTLADWKDGVDGSDTAVDMSAVAAVDTWSEGCMATSDTKYVHFQVVVAR